MNGIVESKIGDFVVEAKVIRANGEIEDLGIIAGSKQNIFVKILRRIKKWLM